MPRIQHLARTLSYANRRRLEIARALVSRPVLLLLDEPTAGMNPTETLELTDQIRHLRDRGVTVLMIEHKLDVVNEIADKVIVLDHGEKIAEGTPKEVHSNKEVLVPISDAQQTQSQRRPPLLEFNDVNTYYGELHVLKGVNYQVGDGEIVCLLGGNASGKSTTMKTILGIVKPKSGHVIYGGSTINDLPTAERVKRGIAPVPEARRLFPRMTVLENLEMGAFTRVGYDRDRSRHGTGLRAVPAHQGTAQADRPERCRAASSRWWPWGAP